MSLAPSTANAEAIALGGAASGAVSPVPRTDYHEERDDLSVKVMGGSVAIKRSYVDSKWHPNYAWAPLQLTLDSIDGSVKEIKRNSDIFKKTADGVFTFGKRFYIRQTATGFRWANRNGDWIEYDDKGNIQTYGNRNNVKVSFEYGTYNDAPRITGVLDHFGQKVFTLEYTGDKLTTVKDYTNRKVQYKYDAVGNLVEVLDVLGNSWKYVYAENRYTDMRCEIEYRYVDGKLVKVSDQCFPVEVSAGWRLLSVTDPEGRTATRAFAANGFYAGQTYPDGTKQTYTYDYDASKKQHYVKEVSPGGKVTESWYNEEGYRIRQAVNGRTTSTLTFDGRKRIETNERGLATTYEYDEWDNPTKVIYPDNTQVSYTYDPTFSNVTQKTDARGTITKYEYNTKGNLIKLTEAFGLPEQRITSCTYDDYGNRLTLKRHRDAVTQEAVTTYTYDKYGNVVSITDPEDHKTSYTRDALGNTLTKFDARGKTWINAYDAAGRLVSRKNPLGHTTRYEYDKVGNLTKTIDAANNEILYTYDTKGRVAKITDPYGGITQYEYNAEGQQTKQTDQEGRTQATEYDLDGRLAKTIDGNGNVTAYVYGDEASGLNGSLVRTNYPTFAQEYKYDLRGRVIEVIDVLDASTRLSTKTAYDAAGNQVSIIDKENKTATYRYDTFHRLAKITDAANGTTEYIYDARGNLIALIDQRGNTHRFEYDRRNLKTREIRPLGQAISYAYDEAGNLKSVIDPNGQVKKYAYDDAGRRTTESHYLTTADTTAAKTTTYSHNDLGALTGYSDDTSAGTNTYDTRQLRKLGETVNHGAFSFSYGYDYYANGLKKSFTGPDGVTVHYTYDSNNQLTAIQLPNGSVTVNSYAWIAPAKITFPGGSTRMQGYDALMRLKSIEVKDPTQTQALSYQYAYDKAGNITQKATELGAYSYAYDALYRLTAATSPSPLLNEAYAYDPVGNRLADNNLPGSWQYDANNQLIQAGNPSFTYDANGNTVTKTEGTTATTFVYDTSDRLIEIKDDQGSIIGKYGYDPFGRRIWKETNNQRTYFFYADEGLISEANMAGAITKLYGYRPNSTWTTDPLYLKQGSSYYFYQNDHLGTPQKLINVNGQLVWSATAQAFGNTTPNDSAAVTNNLRFPGQYFDAESSLTYNGARYYSSVLGRFLQPDPVSVGDHVELAQIRLNSDAPWSSSPPLELNPYAYVANNPLRWTDPDGLSIAVIKPFLPGANFKRPPRVPGRYACNARCPTIPAQCPGPDCPIVYGYGEDTSLAKAIREAKSDANSKVPLGCQAKHCTYKCTGPRGDPIYPSN